MIIYEILQLPTLNYHYNNIYGIYTIKCTMYNIYCILCIYINKEQIENVLLLLIIDMIKY